MYCFVQAEDGIRDSLVTGVQTCALPIFYELGKKYKYELKDWFLFLYETLLGQKNGPRLGTFILLLSIKETIKLIEDSFSR